MLNTGGPFGVLIAAIHSITAEKQQCVAMMTHIAAIAHQNARISQDNDGLRRQVERLEKARGPSLDSPDKGLQDIVHALTVPVQKRDPYTYGHQKRVTRLAAAIAHEMGLPPSEVEGIRLAAAVHDIGKIIVPFEILNRPSYLSEAEFILIRMHPQVAFEILSPISFPWPVPEIVRQHHERQDGSGYPLGLRAGQITTEASVLAVADVVEAMSSHRPYRAAVGIDAALDEISNRSGILYDPEAVAACIRLLLIKNFNIDEEAIQTATPSPFSTPDSIRVK